MAYLFLRNSTWQGGDNLHSIMETIATCAALVVGVLGLARFYSKKTNLFLFIGTGFVGTALLDGYHDVVTSTWFSWMFPSALPSLTPWSGMSSRVFLSVFLWLSWLAWRREARWGPQGRFSERTIYLVAGALTLGSFLLFILFPLPPAYFQGIVLPRPEELVSAAFFLLALVGYLRKGYWKRDYFEHWLVLSLIVSVLNQAAFMSCSSRLFDTMYFAAHLLRILSYIYVLIGLVISMYFLTRRAEESAEERQRSNEALRAEVAERTRVERDLRLDDARLEALLKLGQMTQASLQEITNFVLEQGVALTRSTIGYLAFTNEDETVLTMHSWSKSAMKECAIADKPIVYPIVTTGLWGEAVRQRKPVVTNDYAAPNPLKKGFPQGHVKVLRHMNIPVFDGDRIVAVAGVGNKERPYEDPDVRQLTLLTEGMWRLIKMKRADEALRKAHDELETRVQQRTAELANANEALQLEIAERKRADDKLRQTMKDLARSNAELEQFAYVASHDLQEPLRMVGSYVQLLARRYKGKFDSDADEFITFAVDGARRMQSMIDDLLTLSRVGTSGKPFQPTDCARVLDQALINLQAAIQQSGAVVTHDPLPTVMADEMQLVQLFQNLIGNGIKFRNASPPRVHVAARREGAEWVFSVRDNGIGIDPKHFDHMFVIFHRLHSRRKYPGTGIGLAVCKKIVDRHHGRIGVESAPGKGSTFYFSIPSKERGGTCEHRDDKQQPGNLVGGRQLRGCSPCQRNPQRWEDTSQPERRRRRRRGDGLSAQRGKVLQRIPPGRDPPRPEPAEEGRPGGARGDQERQKSNVHTHRGLD